MSSLVFVIQHGWTALIHGAVGNDCSIVTELLSLGADVDIQTNVRLPVKQCEVCIHPKALWVGGAQG